VQRSAAAALHSLLCLQVGINIGIYVCTGRVACQHKFSAELLVHGPCVMPCAWAVGWGAWAVAALGIAHKVALTVAVTVAHVGVC
jgi:hypothetical protein